MQRWMRARSTLVASPTVQSRRERLGRFKMDRPPNADVWGEKAK
jgi:hypothetical protein